MPPLRRPWRRTAEFNPFAAVPDLLDAAGRAVHVILHDDRTRWRAYLIVCLERAGGSFSFLLKIARATRESTPVDTEALATSIRC